MKLILRLLACTIFVLLVQTAAPVEASSALNCPLAECQDSFCAFESDCLTMYAYDCSTCDNYCGWCNELAVCDTPVTCYGSLATICYCVL